MISHILLNISLFFCFFPFILIFPLDFSKIFLGILKFVSKGREYGVSSGSHAK